MNQKISTGLGTVILIIIAITAGVFVWKVYKVNPISYKQADSMISQRTRSIKNQNNGNNDTPSSTTIQEQLKEINNSSKIVISERFPLLDDGLYSKTVNSKYKCGENQLLFTSDDMGNLISIKLSESGKDFKINPISQYNKIIDFSFNVDCKKILMIMSSESEEYRNDIFELNTDKKEYIKLTNFIRKNTDNPLDDCEKNPSFLSAIYPINGSDNFLVFSGSCATAVDLVQPQAYIFNPKDGDLQQIGRQNNPDKFVLEPAILDVQNNILSFFAVDTNASKANKVEREDYDLKNNKLIMTKEIIAKNNKDTLYSDTGLNIGNCYQPAEDDITRYYQECYNSNIKTLFP